MASNLIDDDESTFWHNEWASGNMICPCHVIINLGGLKELTRMELLRRLSNDDTKEVEISLTTDSDWENAKWTLVETITYGTSTAIADQRKTIDWTEHKEATFVKVEITKGETTNAASLAEFTLWGWAQ